MQEHSAQQFHYILVNLGVLCFQGSWIPMYQINLILMF